MKISFSKRNRKSNIFSINSTDQGNTLAHTVIFLLSSRGFLGPLKEEMSKMLARCKQDAILSCFSRVNDDRCSNCHVSDSLNNNFSCLKYLLQYNLYWDSFLLNGNCFHIFIDFSQEFCKSHSFRVSTLKLLRFIVRF